jgi:hypothetical protein
MAVNNVMNFFILSPGKLCVTTLAFLNPVPGSKSHEYVQAVI